MSQFLLPFSKPLQKPLLIFNGDCGFCRLWVRRWRLLTADHIDYAASQEVAAQFPEIPLTEFEKSVQLLEPDGKRTSAAGAVCKTLYYAGRPFLWRAYDRFPGFSVIIEFFYSIIASHRPLAHRLTHLFWGDPAVLSTYERIRPLYLRSLAFIYVLAFGSLAFQVSGLMGSQGILPVRETLESAFSQLGRVAYWAYPSLFWWSAGDRFLHLVCWSGALVGVVNMLGRPRPLGFLFLWATYLSLVSAGGPFMSFQWDTLLLEAGFLAIALAASPAPVWRWLTRWLVFRLMFQSAWVKLASGDLLWRQGAALTVHFQTQPLPNPLSWSAHHLPHALLFLSCWLVLLIEGIGAFLVWMPRRARYFAFLVFVGLQILIALTGNYGFFNLLTIVLCIALLDDQFLARAKTSS